MRLRVWAGILGAALGLGAAGCSDSGDPYFGTAVRKGKSPSTFYVNLGVEPEFVDPGRASEAAGTLLVSHLFEGLGVYDPKDAHPTQGVAYTWEKSDDNRLFRFHLRKEARWSDGKPVTAHDFVFAWTRVLDPLLASRAATVLHALLNGEVYQRGQLKVTREKVPVRDGVSADARVVDTLEPGTLVRILKTEGELSQVARHERRPAFDPAKTPAPEVANPSSVGFVKSSDLHFDSSVLGVRATDDYTLEIEAERPTPYMLDLTCYSALSPMRRDVVEPLTAKGKVDALNRPENIVGNGPYSIADWKFRYEIVMQKNPAYWRANEVKIDRVVWMMMEDYKSTLNLYKAGDLDYIGDTAAIPVDAMPWVENKKDFVRSQYLAVAWYDLNLKKASARQIGCTKSAESCH
ncbi:MAG: hypothetical protein IPK82_27275 [Polyangiaceae bacterium]|nr:hypothetical protein [Polyangiaceae bacterium]